MPLKASAAFIAGEIGFLGYQFFDTGLGEFIGTVIAYSVARLTWYFLGDKMKVGIKKITVYVKQKLQIK